MAMLSLGESRWRMLRRVIGQKRFKYEDARNMNRKDEANFEWLVEHGFFTDLGNEFFQVTAKGSASAELGFYEFRTCPPG